MKGFIEVTIISGLNEIKEIHPVKNIEKIKSFDIIYCIILLNNGDYIMPSESYKEIKQLIKQAQ